nr:SDR family oxidoreductase [uncultured Flavobacterium sp.]
MDSTFKGQVVLVTGGTKGIGKAIADKLKNKGAEVIVAARNIPETGAEGYYFIAADLALPQGAEVIAKEIIERYGRIDIIVNNAGANLAPGGGYSTLSDDDWNNDWQLNFMSAVRINKALLPLMIEKKSGTIINISTGAAKQPIWDMTMSYSSAKAALNAYSKALADELGPLGIRVNVVSPGLVKTTLMLDFIENISVASGTAFDDTFNAILDKVGVPLKRMAEPAEVADVVAFLASSEARYITGANYSVDGGASPTV